MGLDTTRERAIERRLRRHAWVVPIVTLATAIALYAALGECLVLYRAGHTAIVIASGLVAHAIMIVTVHDGAHRAITRTAADRWITSIAAGALIMPLYGEAFRRYHLLHHRHPNGPLDPLYSPGKARLFARSRALYMVTDVIPMLLTFVCPATAASALPALRMRAKYMVAGLVASGVVIALVRPEIAFVAGTIVTLYAWATIRDWCEHFGIPASDGRIANAYWFPLGMGIGNHAAHHRHPSHAWLTMAIGLRARSKTHPVRAAIQMATRHDFDHYR